MKTRARYARMLLCALLLLSSLLVLATTTTTSATSVLGVATTNSTMITVSTGTNQTVLTKTVTNSTTITVTVTNSTRIVVTTYLTLPDVPLVPGYISIPSEIIPAMVVGFVIVVLALFGSALILRSRLSRALDELNELKTQPSIAAPETGLSTPSALKRLLELGVLQPKEYMEKKILAERIEKKMSAKQLLDKGLISQEQYDTLARKQE
jgi:hypothetical protein